jgi:hypothetical protein
MIPKRNNPTNAKSNPELIISEKSTNNPDSLGVKEKSILPRINKKKEI